MRRYAFPFSVILLFFIMLSFPQEVFDGASEGLLLWFQIVLPTLLPFIIISNIIRTLKICKNVRYFMKLSVESYRILEIYCIFAAVMTFNKR